VRRLRPVLVGQIARRLGPVSGVRCLASMASTLVLGHGVLIARRCLQISSCLALGTSDQIARILSPVSSVQGYKRLGPVSGFQAARRLGPVPDVFREPSMKGSRLRLSRRLGPVHGVQGARRLRPVHGVQRAGRLGLNRRNIRTKVASNWPI
jgi:hypothetical protein